MNKFNIPDITVKLLQKGFWEEPLIGRRVKLSIGGWLKVKVVTKILIWEFCVWLTIKVVHWGLIESKGSNTILINMINKINKSNTNPLSYSSFRIIIKRRNWFTLVDFDVINLGDPPIVCHSVFVDQDLESIWVTNFVINNLLPHS
jgi:hypothetical protein